MSTLFLIGNGFDLNCGLDTRYTDMYEGYVSSVSKSDNIVKFKKTIASDYKLWSDFELSLAKHANTFQNETEMIECINDFSVYMRGHLLKEQERFFDLIKIEDIRKEVLEEVDRSFKSYCIGFSHNIDRLLGQRNPEFIGNIQFATFNYTKVIDKVIAEYVARTSSYKNVLHIHGMIDEDPVLGVDNEEQLGLPYNLSSKGQRRLIKPTFNKIYDSRRVSDLLSMIRHADIIVTFGLSLGETDITWRKEIIQWLFGSPGNHLIVCDYNLSTKKYETINDRLDEEEDAKLGLLESWGILNEREEFIDKIHIMCGKSIFNIKKILEKAKK